MIIGRSTVISQDTLLALEALKKFSFSQTNRAFYNLQLSFVCSSNDTWSNTVSLDKSNFASLFQFPVSTFFTLIIDVILSLMLFTW